MNANDIQELQNEIEKIEYQIDLAKVKQDTRLYISSYIKLQNLYYKLGQLDGKTSIYLLQLYNKYGELGKMRR